MIDPTANICGWSGLFLLTTSKYYHVDVDTPIHHFSTNTHNCREAILSAHYVRMATIRNITFVSHRSFNGMRIP